MLGDNDIQSVVASAPGTFHDVLRFWAKRTPDAPAFLTETGVALRFNDVLDRIEEIGASLNARGFGRGDRIAVIHPGGVDLAVAIVGIWSHATVIALSPTQQLGEYATYLRDLRLDAVAIAAGKIAPAREAADQLGIPILDLVPVDGDGSGHIRLEGPTANRPHKPGLAGPDDVAVVLMTSGTTLERKLVPRRHSHLVLRAEDYARMLQFTRAERGANLMQLHHGAGLGAITYAPFAGGSVAHFPGKDMPRIFRCLEHLKPTHISGPYTAFHAMLAQQDRLRESIHCIRPGLRMLRTGAGHLDARVAENLEALFEVPVIQAYSSSETGFIACEPLPPIPRKRGSVGLPGSTKIAIIDDRGDHLPANDVGEIIVSGPKVLDGYENNPVANADSFIDGWFRTGDLGYFDTDGYLFLTGRIKELINRGGQKIMPGEIDAAIMAHPDVAAAAAFPVPHPTLGDDVAAAVVLQPGATLTRKTLIDAVRKELGDAKIPRLILFVDDIPKGETGKIQRYKLAAAFGLDGSTRPSGKGAAPSTSTEVTLQRIWSETLQLQTVAVDEDFFSLGGDSILAVELFLRIEEELGRRLPRAALFEASTVAEMARHIDISAPARCLVPIQPNGDRPPLFCVHDIYGQVLNFRMLAQHLGPDQPVYGLQLAGLDGTETPLARYEDMAARYISEIRLVQPSGPYHIGGYSMGGSIAYEMAQQLRDAGEKVDLLGLFDAFPRYGPRRSLLADWFTQKGNTLSDSSATAVARYIGRGFGNIAQNVGTAIWRRLFGLAWRFCERRMSTIPKPLHRPIAASYLASRSYRMRPYAGDAVLFMAEDNRNDHDHVVENWRKLIGGQLDIRPISGLHNEILAEPHVRMLARELSRCLRKSSGQAFEAAAEE